MQTLSDYVKEQLKAGYKLESIRQVLLKYYPVQEIEKAVKEARFKSFPILPLTIIILVLCITLILVWYPQEELPLPLTVQAAISPDTVIQGKEVVVTVEVSDGIKAKHSVNLELTLNDEEGNILAELKDFVIVQTSGKRSKPIKTGMKPGVYTIVIKASGEDKSAETTASFTVIAPERKEPTGQTIQESKPQITPQEKTPAQFQSKKVEQPEVPGEPCTNVLNQDSCYSQLAATTNDKKVCSKIVSTDSRDSCLSFFFLHNDFSVCPDIRNEQLRNSCESIKSFEQGTKSQAVELPEQFKEEAVIGIIIKDSAFGPANLEINSGTTITWKNEDEAMHSVQSDDETFQSEELEQGDPFSFTFQNPGTYPYHCGIHESMRGIIVVK